MGSMKDYMLDLEAERFKEWFAEQYPDAQPGGEEWEQAGLLYYWEQEALADKAQWDYERGAVCGFPEQCSSALCAR